MNMVRAWVLYILLLFGSFLFFLFYTEYISFFLFAAVLLFPLFSLLFFLLGKRKIRLHIQPVFPLAKSGTCSFTLGIEKPCFLPLLKLRTKVILKNTFSGEELSQIMEFPLSRGKTSLSIPCTSNCCGRVLLSLSPCRVYDFTRLFYASVPSPQPEAAFFLPPVPLFEPEGQAFSRAEGMEETNSRRRGGDPSEIFDLRSWQAGDRLRDIHWKLSMRTEETIVKEHASPMLPPLRLYIHFCGNAAEQDGILETAAALGTAFCGNGMHIELFWEDYSQGKDAGQLRSFLLQEQEEVLLCLQAMLSSVPNPNGNLSELSPTKTTAMQILLTGPVTPDELEKRFLAEDYSPKEVLVVSEENPPQEEFLSRMPNISIFYLQPGHIEEGLRCIALRQEKEGRP